MMLFGTYFVFLTDANNIQDNIRYIKKLPVVFLKPGWSKHSNTAGLYFCTGEWRLSAGPMMKIDQGSLELTNMVSFLLFKVIESSAIVLETFHQYSHTSPMLQICSCKAFLSCTLHGLIILNYMAKWYIELNSWN